MTNIMENNKNAVVAFDGLAVGESGPEEDTIVGVGESIGACSLIEACGGETVDWYTAFCFQQSFVDSALGPNSPVTAESAARTDRRMAQKIEDYKHETGHSLPPVYRLKITVECEKVDAAVAEKYWRDRGSR